MRLAVEVGGILWRRVGNDPVDVRGARSPEVGR